MSSCDAHLEMEANLVVGFRIGPSQGTEHAAEAAE